MANSPLQKIVTASAGRGAQLDPGPGNNQYCRASDFNPVVDYVNNQAGVNAGTVTQTAGALTNAVTLNSVAGVITTSATSLAAATAASFTLTNSYITTSSIVVATVTQGGAAGSLPVVASIVPSNGSAVITLYNMSAATATGTNALKISFIVF